MKNTKINTWRELEKFVQTIPDEVIDEKVSVFVFANGEMEILNGINFVGNSKKVDSHCGDISQGCMKRGMPYLLCGL
jgi:hypothetical protein